MKQIITGIALVFTVLLLASSASAARKHRWYSNQSNTYGWEIMTPEERTEYHATMQNLTNHKECTDHIEQHTKKMEARAREQGVDLPAIKENVCDIMQGRKMYK